MPVTAEWQLPVEGFMFPERLEGREPRPCAVGPPLWSGRMVITLPPPSLWVPDEARGFCLLVFNDIS